MFDVVGEVKAHLSGTNWPGVYTEIDLPYPTRPSRPGMRLKASPPDWLQYFESMSELLLTGTRSVRGGFTAST